MLQVHSSNHLESLLDHLLTRINQGDPFCAEVIVVENPGMSRWLQQRIAEYDGISANLKFISVAQFVWQSAQCWIEDLPEPPQRNSTKLQWQIFSLLPDFLSQSAFTELQKYLKDDDSGLQRFQLAGRIAGTFEKYLVYRAELIDEWQQGKGVHWQAVLWRAIAPEIPYTWGDLRQQLINTGGAAPRTPPLKPLPERVSVFGVSDMAPIYIDLLQLLGTHSSICIYYLNPCSGYWADIRDEKSQARRRARAYSSRLGRDDDPTGLLDIGNPLLASWGHAGQSFLDQLLERQVQESESFVVPEDDSLLHRVQRDVLLLEDKSDGSGGPVEADDHSVFVHSAHSPLREVQILHDQLLGLFTTMPGLKPRDIIVMAPDIDQYAPFVTATFGTAPAEQFIPWSISDRRMRAEQQLLEALLLLLKLPESRFTSTDVFALLQVPAVKRKFSLERSDLSRLHQWIQESGIRWSLDAEMRTELGLPATESNSWDFGLQRMFLGYAMPSEEGRLYADVAPYNELEGSDSERLEQLQLFIDLARRWRNRLANAECSPVEWLHEIDQLADAFFEPDHSEDYSLRSFREMLVSSFAEVGDAAVNLQILTEVVQSALDDNSNVRQFLNGKVTFSNMVPMRCIPFKVICLIGMNAADFPREDRPMSFDLTTQKPRRGDRSRSNDDRYLFLETLLSARQKFYLSYVGKDIRDNTDKAPATVVTEMLAYINASYQRLNAPEEGMPEEGTPDEEASVDDAVSALQHPLQPFSKRYFDQSNGHFKNHKPLWFQAASTQRQAGAFIDTVESRAPTDNVVPSDRQLDEPSKQVSLSQLVLFFSKPSVSYLMERLQVGGVYTADDLSTAEQFDLDNLERWKMDQAVLEYGKHMPKAEVRTTLDAQGVLPAGVFGDAFFNDSYRRGISLDIRVLAHQSETIIEPLDFELDVGDFQLGGYLSQLGNNGMVFWRAGKRRIADLLSVWIRHLCLCAAAPSGLPKRSVYVFTDVTVEFKEVPDPLVHLQVLLGLRHQGLLRPILFFPGSSYEASMAGDEDAAFSAAYKTWSSERYRDSNHIVWREQDALFNDEFLRVANLVFSPWREYLEERPEKDETPETLPDEMYLLQSSQDVDSDIGVNL